MTSPQNGRAAVDSLVWLGVDLIKFRNLRGDVVQQDSFEQVLGADKKSCFHKENTTKLLAGDYTIELRREHVPAKEVIDRYPKSGWDYAVERSAGGLRIRVRGDARDRLLVVDY